MAVNGPSVDGSEWAVGGWQGTAQYNGAASKKKITTWSPLNDDDTWAGTWVHQVHRWVPPRCTAGCHP
eukprot:200994-Chlamydomonas_euryale.AAC.1